MSPSARIPTYRHNKTTGRAVVTINGRDYWLGAYNSPESRQKYDRLIAEWLANDRQAPEAKAPADLTISELIARFWIHVESYYRKADGTPTSEVENYRQALRPLEALYGPTAAATFRPRSLKAVRQKMILANLCRTNINKQAARILGLFKWAVANELVPESVHRALRAVAGLRKGRSDVRESEPVRPVPEAYVDAVLPYVSPQVRAMIQLQRFTGMRPGEAVIMRGRDVDTSGEVWEYRPGSHKTEHLGHHRVIYLGPHAKAILQPFLRPNLQEYLFSPEEAELQRRKAMHAARRTPLSCGNTPGSNVASEPQRPPRTRYTETSYRRAVARACDRAFRAPEHLARRRVRGGRGAADMRRETAAEWKARLGPERWAELQKWRTEHRWHPHQLRHNAATYLRKQYGLEKARVVLGHRSSAITEVYAEADLSEARRIMGEVG